MLIAPQLRRRLPLEYRHVPRRVGAAAGAVAARDAARNAADQWRGADVARRRVHPSCTIRSNPRPEALAAGKSLFDSNCAVCHGNGARGDGTVRFLLRVPPADLTAGVAAQRSDGYIYATIRNGSIVMPSYADAMSSRERWEVVLYLRSLQGKVAAK